MPKVKSPLSKKQLEEVSILLQGISHPLRLGIVSLLLTDELSVNELSNHLNISQSVTSQHLSKLKECGILDSRKESNKVFYYIKNLQYRNFIQMIFKFQETLETTKKK
jgi:DNA-binding transcriptional ArsR family regulator